MFHPLSPEREAPSGAEIKNAWSYTSTSTYVFMAWHLMEQTNLPQCFVNETNCVMHRTYCSWGGRQPIPLTDYNFVCL
jgi:hypothetical protein